MKLTMKHFTFSKCRSRPHVVFWTNRHFIKEWNSRILGQFERHYSSHTKKQCELKTDHGVKEVFTRFPPVYIAADVEAKVHEWWEREGYCQPSTYTDKSNSFSIVLPPPNVTGTLHLGHALTTTIQDVLVRWNRMLGKSVLWVPGTDHAGIATQVAVEKKLWQEKKLTRHDIGREEFEKKIWEWKNEKGEQITKQLRKLGASLDWSRETFTMDRNQSEAVMEAFIHLYDAGLIYRENTLVNWSCILQSAISDIEVAFKEIRRPTRMSIPGYTEPVEFGVLSNIAYKLCNSDEEIVVSTTRIETIPGDVAVAVNPLDKRYKKWHGSEVWHPIRQEKIPVICDTFVDPTFGTGAVKITPGHSLIDFEIGRKHNLPVISIISEDGTLNKNCGKYFGQRRFDARKIIADDLNKQKLLRGKQDHAMTVPICSRSGDAVELLMKSQWFINCQEMGKQAAKVVANGDLQIEPPVYEKTWFNWVDNIRDWCVSRQLWWGHRIPMYNCYQKGNVESTVWVAAKNNKEACKKALHLLDLPDAEEDNIVVVQDSDVLDTWFSSALFPFSSIGWPSQKDDFDKYYPLSLMETGHDILFFWVARMVMLGIHCTGILPFKRVLLHGIICDSSGRKMSKSLGNVINPEDVIQGISLQELADRTHQNFEAGLISMAELKKALADQRKLFPKGIPECGTDALRFTLCSQNVKNVYINFDVDKCHNNHAFCNKIWQVCRYVHQCFERMPSANGTFEVGLSRMDCWILSRLAFMVAELDTSLCKADFHIATSALRTFLYKNFCDVYVETTKPIVKSNTPQAGAACWTLVQCLDTTLRALSPFMPFISEILYQHLPHVDGINHSKSIMIAPYPKPDEWNKYRDKNLEKEVEMVHGLVCALRRLKSIYNIKSKASEVHIVSNNTQERELYSQYIDTIATLVRCGNVVITSEPSAHLMEDSVTEPVGINCSVYIIIEDKDPKMEQKEVLKKCNSLSKDLTKLKNIIAQPGYSEKASLQIQETHYKQIQTVEAELTKLSEYQEFLKRWNKSKM